MPPAEPDDICRASISESDIHLRRLSYLYFALHPKHSLDDYSGGLPCPSPVCLRLYSLVFAIHRFYYKTVAVICPGLFVHLLITHNSLTDTIAFR